MVSNQAKFNALRAKHAGVKKQADEILINNQVKYGSHGDWRRHCIKKDLRKYESLRDRQEKVMAEFFALLDEVSPRQFRSGVPADWVIEKLTWEDATTEGQMSVVPPICFGGQQRDALRFAQPVKKEVSPSW